MDGWSVRVRRMVAGVRLTLCGWVLLAGVGLGELAWANHDGDPSMIHGCANENTGRLRVLSPGESCNLQTEREITWLSLSGSIRRARTETASPATVFYYSYFMNTGTVQEFLFGQTKLQTTGMAGQFRVCTTLPGTVGPVNFVVHVNGIRTAGSVTGGCSQVFDVGAGGDFQVSSRLVQIFGVHSGDSTSNENYLLIGFGSLF